MVADEQPRPEAVHPRRRAAGRLRAMFASRSEIEAAEERRETVRAGCTAVADLTPRRQARVFGVLRNVRLRPADQVPALEAELYDGSGALRVIWLGRRAVGGIEPGRRLQLEGLACYEGGRPTMYNPRYDLQPRPGECDET
jgi:hypothetical protein